MSQKPWEGNQNPVGRNTPAEGGSYPSANSAHNAQQDWHQQGQDPTTPLPPQQNPSYEGQYAGQGQRQEQHAGYEQTQQWSQHDYNDFSEKRESQKKKHTTTALLSAALIAALVGGGAGAGAALLSDGNSSSTVGTSTAGTTIVNNTESVNEVTAAAAKATPSVVTIGVSSKSGQGSGSGIILDNEGHILTNTHVVTLDGAASKATIEVQLSDGTVKKATLVGTDPTNDLAVIKVDTAGLKVTPATLGDSDKINVGDTSLAIGAPLGLQNTVTDGIISTLSRTIEVASSEAPAQESDSSDDLGSQESPYQFEIPGQNSPNKSSSTISINVIQTDAAVNPGNSGGALVNAQGDVIGVNVAIASAGSSSSESSSGNIGVGFAIPINNAKRIAQEIIDNGHASHGFLGASVATSPGNDDSSGAFGDGAVIRTTSKDGPAANAGLREGDVITEFNGQRINEANELTAAVRQVSPNTTVKVKYQRGSSTEETDVTVGNVKDTK